ncbi:bifunctional metallophosphatase/5'-nucleotidase [Anaerorhabdus sp.]|uniref:bifunctional metallophosphatase/5'-nucleotidase n=1 Tax=Anaerorhabdus sp. TaxID=1872524 RepID=UPI002FCAC09E
MKIYHTNDIHSEFEKCASLATYFQMHKTADDLYIDAGDFCDLKDISIVGTNGLAGSKLLNGLSCDAFCVGNNEADLGYEALKKIGYNSNLLSCNLKKIDESDIEHLTSSLLITKNNIRFLIIGISPYFKKDMTPNGYNLFLELDGLKTMDPFDCIKKEIEKNENNYDFCILLSHSGFVIDEVIAKQLPKVGLIIGGHSHTLLKEPVFIEDTMIIQCGEYANYIGCLDFEIVDKKISSFNYSLIANDFEKDKDFLKLIEDCRKDALNELSKPLIYNCNLDYDPFKECTLMNYICDCLYEESDCDFAMAFHGIMNHSLQGNISLMDLIECSPSKLNPTRVVIKGKQVREAIKLSMDYDYIHQSGKGPGFRGTVLGTLSVSHNVEINEKEILIDGKVLNDSYDYVVMMDDYLQRGTCYPTLATPDEDAKFFKGFIRDCVGKNLKDKKYFEQINKKRKKRNV